MFQKVNSVVFQCLDPHGLFSALYWRLRGVPVYAQAFRYLPKGVVDLAGIKSLSVDSRPSIRKVRLELVESVFHLLLEETRHVAWSRRLFGSKDIDQAFKRRILEELEDFFVTTAGIVCAGLSGSGPVLLSGCSNLPAEFVALVQKGHLPQEALDQVESSHLEVIQCLLIRLLLEVGISFWFVFKRLRWYLKPREEFQLAIRSYFTDWGFDAGGLPRIRNVDFLVDGKGFHPGNTIFWLEDAVQEDQYKMGKLRERGYRYAFPSRLVYDRHFAWRIALPVLIGYIGYRLSAGTRDLFEARTCRGLWKSYLTARAFAEYFHPRYLVVYNDVGFNSTARNLALRLKGCSSVFYPHSYNWAIDSTGYWRTHPWISFVCYDILASWGKLQADYYRSAGGRYGESLTLGCLWSEHGRLVQENETINNHYSQQLSSFLTVPLDRFQRGIGVFDTSISSMLFASDLIRFYAGILQLSRRLKDVLFVLKPKYPVEELFSQAGELERQVSEEIRGASNIVLLPQYFETASIIGLTDLTISACFTSTTVEAIGCGKRAVYYNPTNRMPHAFWCRIPGMVCVSDEELYDRVHYLLYKCEDKVYVEYLRTHCMGIESHFDGRAITRLRQRLLDPINGRQAGTAAHG